MEDEHDMHLTGSFGSLWFMRLRGCASDCPVWFSALGNGLAIRLSKVEDGWLTTVVAGMATIPGPATSGLELEPMPTPEDALRIHLPMIASDFLEDVSGWMEQCVMLHMLVGRMAASGGDGNGPVSLFPESAGQ